jgi:hypothetical protein
MDEILTQIEIAASAKEVWSVLTDFEAYSKWNTMMWPGGGDARQGAKLRVRVRLGGWLRFTFSPTIRTADPRRELSWRGRLPARLLQGVHSFCIEPVGPNRVRFTQREVYSGLLAPFYMLLMSDGIKQAYDRMNRELKSRVEQICAQSSLPVPDSPSPSAAPASS